MSGNIERLAKAIYELHPYFECGEYIDGFPVSPGGALTWEQAKAREAEFPEFQFTADSYAAARLAVATLRKPTEAMLNAARDWSHKKYGKPIGNEGPAPDASMRDLSTVSLIFKAADDLVAMRGNIAK